MKRSLDDESLEYEIKRQNFDVMESIPTYSGICNELINTNYAKNYAVFLYNQIKIFRFSIIYFMH